MRIVVTGATGNVGTSLLEALTAEPVVDSIVGLCRRPPRTWLPKTRFVAADVASAGLESLFRGADAVVHLAWLIQPSREPDILHRTNVIGSRRVFEAAANAGVSKLVYASSVGVYSPGPKDTPVDENWPTDGIETSIYSRHKAEVEHALDDLERSVDGRMRIVRLRKALVFKREAAEEIRRYFVGPLIPRPIFRQSWIPLVPDTRSLRFQAVHSHDAALAYRLALTRDVEGAFNIAADPVLDGRSLGEILRARPVPVPAPWMRAAVSASWRLRLQPTEPGWVDLAFSTPVLDTTRARAELGWCPRHGADAALLDLLAGLRDGAGAATPPLQPGRVRPFATIEASR